MAPPRIGGIQPAPGQPVYRVATIRSDKHQGGPSHFNQNETLIFRDQRGKSWRLYAKDQPGHFVALSNDSGLTAAFDLYGLPAAKKGKLSDLERRGLRVDFSTGSGP